MEQSNIVQLALVGAGLFSIAGAYFDWDWFINWRNARWLVSLLGRNGARVWHGLVGVALVGYGVLALAGVFE